MFVGVELNARTIARDTNHFFLFLFSKKNLYKCCTSENNRKFFDSLLKIRVPKRLHLPLKLVRYQRYAGKKIYFRYNDIVDLNKIRSKCR